MFRKFCYPCTDCSTKHYQIYMYLNFLSQYRWLVVRLQNNLHFHLGTSNLSNKRDDTKWQTDVFCRPVSKIAQAKHFNIDVYVCLFNSLEKLARKTANQAIVAWNYLKLHVSVKMNL